MLFDISICIYSYIMSNKIHPVTVLKTSYIKNIVEDLKYEFKSNLVHKTVYYNIEKRINRKLNNIEKKMIHAYCSW